MNLLGAPIRYNLWLMLMRPENDPPFCPETLSTTGELVSVMCPIAAVMADAWCLRRTAAPPLRSFRIVGRVMMSRPMHFEVRQSRSYRVRAMEVGSPLWWICMGAVRGKRALRYIAVKIWKKGA
jgi:hypothetical protein